MFITDSKRSKERVSSLLYSFSNALNQRTYAQMDFVCKRRRDEIMYMHVSICTFDKGIKESMDDFNDDEISKIIATVGNENREKNQQKQQQRGKNRSMKSIPRELERRHTYWSMKSITCAVCFFFIFFSPAPAFFYPFLSRVSLLCI